MCKGSVLVRARRKMETFACILEDDPSSTYLLPAGAGYYYVPAENVIAKSTRTNQKTCAEIDALLRSNSPEAWKRCLTFGRVMRIRGVEGNALYTTFAPTDGAFDEQRVLRLVPWRVAHACFPEVKEWARCDPRWRFVSDSMRNIYDWKKEVDLPDAPHINPARNDWPAAPIAYPVVVRTPAQIQPLLSDPMEDWDAHLLNNNHAERRAPPPLPPPPPPRQNATPNVAIDVINERANSFIEDHIRQMQAAGLLGGLPYLPPVAPAPVQPAPVRSAPMAEDLRALSDFLFECKDVVEEGAYLAASNALKRVWDRAI